jgi:hypothetical protein
MQPRQQLRVTRSMVGLVLAAVSFCSNTNIGIAIFSIGMPGRPRKNWQTPSFPSLSWPPMRQPSEDVKPGSRPLLQHLIRPGEIGGSVKDGGRWVETHLEGTQASQWKKKLPIW